MKMYIGIFVCLKLPVCQTTRQIFPRFFANTFVAPKIVILIILTLIKYLIFRTFLYISDWYCKFNHICDFVYKKRH